MLVPILRSPHMPEHSARSVAVGIFWAMTPLIGAQMTLVLLTWLAAKKVFKMTFSLPLALIWTWSTNVFTMVPAYYLCYVTGQLMRGESTFGLYAKLEQVVESAFLADKTFSEQWQAFADLFLRDWGVSIALGSIPWGIIFGAVGYYLTVRFSRMRQQRRQRKLEEQQRLVRKGK